MQVEGATGLQSLGAKVAKGGPSVLYHGALAASAATFVGHYPWFATVSALQPCAMCWGSNPQLQDPSVRRAQMQSRSSQCSV